MIAKIAAAKVEKLRGAKSGGSSNAKTQLVETKLAMVRAGWLLEYFSFVRRVCWLSRADCVQRHEIH
jgi:hypothetical protein